MQGSDGRNDHHQQGLVKIIEHTPQTTMRAKFATEQKLRICATEKENADGKSGSMMSGAKPSRNDGMVCDSTTGKAHRSG